VVKIRLKRQGNKHRPFYRIVVAKSTAGRNGAFIEILGTYNPLVKPSEFKVNKERALYWLMEGAQPTETVAYFLKREGVLGEFFSQRPTAEKKYKFLNKAIAVMSTASAVSTPVVEEAPAKTKKEEAPVVEEVATEAPAVEEAAAAEEAPAAEAAPEETVAEAPAEEQA
jgi:small subunit ribosomal protein S16